MGRECSDSRSGHYLSHIKLAAVKPKPFSFQKFSLLRPRYEAGLHLHRWARLRQEFGQAKVKETFEKIREILGKGR